MPTLTILNGELEGYVYEVDKSVINMGRRADNDVCLSMDPRVSRYHARLTHRGDDWVLEDLGSANGTFVGQRRIHGPTVVRPGDRFRMGRTWLSIAPELLSPSQLRAQEHVQLTGADGPVAQGAAAGGNVVYSVRADGPAYYADQSEAQRRLELMSRLGADLAPTLDLGQLLDHILTNVMEVIPAERAFVMLVDRASGEFVPQAMFARDGSDTDQAMTVSRSILEYAINERVALMTADALHDERFETLESVQGVGIRSLLCAPLLHGEEALGAIVLDSTSATNVFSEGDVTMLMAIANQVVAAIENARLYTDLRGAYEDLQAAQEQLLRSERLSTVGSITASIAHDMANIVTPLKPLLRMATKECAVDNESYDALSRQMDRLITMVERVTSFSRTGEVRLEPTDVNEVLRRTLTLIRSDITHGGVQLVTEFAPDLPLIMADAAQLDRVFLNLAVNAVQAMESSDERVLTVRTEHDAVELTVSFSDTGPGIPVAIQDKLFEPLFTTKKTGTGLGLHSCKRIVEEEHHGTIALDSLEGIGTTFTVHLPFAAGKTAAPAAPASRSSFDDMFPVAPAAVAPPPPVPAPTPAPPPVPLGEPESYAPLGYEEPADLGGDFPLEPVDAPPAAPGSSTMSPQFDDLGGDFDDLSDIFTDDEDGDKS